MNLPITESEFNYILQVIKSNKQLYNKLWTYLFNYKYQNGK